MTGWADDAMQNSFLKLHCTPRLGEPEDIAALAVFLGSDEAAYCTGGLYLCDGGMSAPLPFAQLQREHLHGKA
jgi:NAD(P)-dependent dehydrogenase (short-subunit alcohol dehydrogenase family)